MIINDKLYIFIILIKNNFRSEIYINNKYTNINIYIKNNES